MHSYPRLIDPTFHTISHDTTSDPQGVESTFREAAASYSAFYNLIMSNSVKNKWITGPAKLQISETHSPTNVKAEFFDNSGMGYFTCEGVDNLIGLVNGVPTASFGQTPAVDTRLAFVGLRQSLASGSDFGGTNIRPIYSSGADGGALYGWCFAPVPLDVKDNGYDKTQP